MADFVFNIAKGKWRYYTSLPAANDAIVVVPIETSGIEADATLKDYDDLASLLAGSSNAQTTMGRKNITTPFSDTINDTSDYVDSDTADITWTAATGNAISALVWCYNPDTSGGGTADSGLIPLFKQDCVMTPDGTDFIAQINASGVARAT